MFNVAGKGGYYLRMASDQAYNYTVYTVRMRVISWGKNFVQLENGDFRE